MVLWCPLPPSLQLRINYVLLRGSARRPSGSFLFSLALAPILDEIKSLSPNLNLWYLDDGVIVGTPDVLQKAWDIIRQKGPESGLHPNPSKCEWVWLVSPCPLFSGSVPSDIPVTPFFDLSILGVPGLGDPFHGKES